MRRRPKVRVKGSGKARAQLEARFVPRGVTNLGSLPFMTRKTYRRSKKVWP